MDVYDNPSCLILLSVNDDSECEYVGVNVCGNQLPKKVMYDEYKITPASKLLKFMFQPRWRTSSNCRRQSGLHTDTLGMEKRTDCSTS